MRGLLVVTLFIMVVARNADAAAPSLSTAAERSGFETTGRYDEVVELCGAFQRAYPKLVRCFEFGRTPEGRPMMALAASAGGALEPGAARQRGLPVVLVQGGIHSGEIDGKDAGFLALRQLLEEQPAAGPLARQVLLFVPVFNIDGHERFGPWNRPNQRGPKEMGWRTTAQNFNLNRDYVKADSPEMQAMLRLVNEWDPLASIDLHVTDGAKFEHDVSIQVEPVYSGDAELRRAGAALRDGVIAELATKGSLPLPFYMSFVVDDDPMSGFVDGVAAPRFSHGYFQLRNRFGMLVETHSWKDYPTRVKVTRNTVLAVLGQVAAHGADWLKAAHEADARSSRLAGQGVPLDYAAGERSRPIEFRGYAYTRTPSEISGGLVTRYDESRPQVWKVSLRDDVQPRVTVPAPGAGYLVPAAQAAAVADKLRLHGIAFRELNAALPQVLVETFRADKTSFEARPFEGRQRLTAAGAWKSERRDLGRGALFVPIAQPKARLAMALLEPQAPDSLLSWGAFNAAFEMKEYMEPYVAEEVARQQLAADPSLAAEFAKKLAADPAFAKDPAARLEFFYRRHSSWDERFNLYPVMRVTTQP
jgi:predicted deacylase